PRGGRGAAAGDLWRTAGCPRGEGVGGRALAGPEQDLRPRPRDRVRRRPGRGGARVPRRRRRARGAASRRTTVPGAGVGARRARSHLRRRRGLGRGAGAGDRELLRAGTEEAGRPHRPPPGTVTLRSAPTPGRSTGSTSDIGAVNGSGEV